MKGCKEQILHHNSIKLTPKSNIRLKFKHTKCCLIPTEVSPRDPATSAKTSTLESMQRHIRLQCKTTLNFELCKRKLQPFIM